MELVVTPAGSWRCHTAPSNSFCASFAFSWATASKRLAQSRDVVGFATRPKIAEVVANLIGVAEGFTVGLKHLLHFFMRLQPGVAGAQAQRHFKSGRSFLAEDVEHLMLSEGLRRAHPTEFRALPPAEL